MAWKVSVKRRTKCWRTWNDSSNCTMTTPGALSQLAKNFRILPLCVEQQQKSQICLGSCLEKQRQLCPLTNLTCQERCKHFQKKRLQCVPKGSSNTQSKSQDCKALQKEISLMARFSMLRIGLAPTAMLKCTPEFFKQAAALARQHPGVRLHSHLAEVKGEVAAIKQKFDASPSQHLRL